MVTTERAGGRAARPGSRRRGKRPWWLLALAVVTVATVVYLVSAYVPPDMATSRIPPRNATHYVLLVAHIFTAAVATIAGLAQFWPWLRSRHPAVHRWTGRAYFFAGVFPSGLLALPVIAYAPFGASNQAALLMLDVAWLFTGVAGYRTVRKRRYADHRRWMIRNYALTLGSLMSRVWGPLVTLTALPQLGAAPYRGDAHGLALNHDIASGSAWLGLIVNMIIAEWYIQRRYGVPRAGRGSASAPAAR